MPIYGVTAAQFPANRSATEYRKRPDYSQRYLGFELAATKRLSNRWMARFGFSSNDHREYFDSRAGMTDPTPGTTSPNVDGGLVVRSSGGSGKSGIFQVLPKYQFIATGLYQAKWGINLAANLVARQGFAMQYNRTLVDTNALFPVGDANAPRKTVFLLDEAGDERLPGVTSLDLRLGKEFAFNRARFNIDLDLFNALNTSTILGRQYRPASHHGQRRAGDHEPAGASRGPTVQLLGAVSRQLSAVSGFADPELGLRRAPGFSRTCGVRWDD